MASHCFLVAYVFTLFSLVSLPDGRAWQAVHPPEDCPNNKGFGEERQRQDSKAARGTSHAFGEVDGIRQHLDYIGSVLSIFINVEPRGFEPLTSAVQSQIHNAVVVRWRSESAANRRVSQ
jgi:hypothetical protein